MPLDAEQIGELLNRHWAVLVAWVGGLDGEAEDIVQSAFIRLAAEEPAPTNCRAWLFTVTRRLAINHRVSRKKRRARELVVGPKDAASTFSNTHALQLDIQELLRELEDRQREVVIARIWGELTFDEIASLTGDAKATVWRTYQAGLEKLRQAYERDLNEPTRI